MVSILWNLCAQPLIIVLVVQGMDLSELEAQAAAMKAKLRKLHEIVLHPDAKTRLGLEGYRKVSSYGPFYGLDPPRNQSYHRFAKVLLVGFSTLWHVG